MTNGNLKLIRSAFNHIIQLGWIDGHRPCNNGSVGNTLEDLLGIPENNLQLPDFGEWELKSKRINSNSLLTLFHNEPEPRNLKFVPRILLPQFGWPITDTQNNYPSTEKSFRATLNNSFSDRGFVVRIERSSQKISIHFDSNHVNPRHNSWLQNVNANRSLDDFATPPYWTFNTLEEKLLTKLHNLVFVKAKTRILPNGIEQFRYTNLSAYVHPTLNRLLNLFDRGHLYVDFDARTGHNHGTKIRITPQYLQDLFDYII